MRSNRRLSFLAVAALLLGGITILPDYLYLPIYKSVSVSELTREPDETLGVNFSVSWPLKINKRFLDEITVQLPDGTMLDSYPTRIALLAAVSGEGFFINRPEIFIRLPENLSARPDALLKIRVPAKLRDVFHKVFFVLGGVLLMAAWLGAGFLSVFRRDQRRSLALSVLSVAIAMTGLVLLPLAKGFLVWLAILGLAIGMMIAVVLVLGAEEKHTGRPCSSKEPLTRAALVLGTVLGCFVLFESYLGLIAEPAEVTDPKKEFGEDEWFQLPADVVQKAKARREWSKLTLPDAWEKQEKSIEGASNAYLWHGALHIHDAHGFRRLNGPFPPKAPGTFRVMVVGDSLTYGYGISPEWTYSSLLESALKPNHQIEILNLGRSGYQSEDILDVLYRFLPRLDPDLVIYAICLNDFLPSGAGEYTSYAFPLPEAWKSFLRERTLLAKFTTDAYQSLLLALGLKADFFDDILAGADGYQRRFARDVSQMNDFVSKSSLPPIMGIVFHQSPGGDPRAWDLIEIAEDALDEAHFNLISVLPWREAFKDQVFPVSRWEGHPNELAHSLVAEALYRRLLKNGYLKGFEDSASPM